MSTIEVRELRKRYGKHQAVAGIDLAVAEGEIFALLGPNGAGKTTTVEILEGHRSRDSGEVRVLGADPGQGARGWRSRIGIVLQQATDAGELTVAESVRHFAGYYPRPRDGDEVLAAVGLTEKATSKVRALSGGQRRRLDVALGIVGRPELLFLDEPTTGFDPQARRQFWELIRSLAGDGTTILLTTHYLDEAEALANRLAVIAEGSIIAEGTPETVGGRSTARSVVSWVDDHGPHEIATDSPTSLIAAHSDGGSRELGQLQVSRPSLEDVYLDMIGATA